MGLITPGSLVAKQDWRRDPTTWRSRFKSVVKPALRASYEEMADALERHFDELPKWKPRWIGLADATKP